MSVDVNSLRYWQIAGGDGDRDIIRYCIDWGVILNGPGQPGDWMENKDWFAHNLYGQKYADLRRFCEEIKDGDRVVLRLGLSEVYAIGIVVGDYQWHPHFGDVDGWDVNHVRRVAWIHFDRDQPIRRFSSRAMKMQTAQLLESEEVLEWARTVESREAREAALSKLPELPEGSPEDAQVEDIADALFRRGVGASSISNTKARIEDVKRLADWYWDEGEWPSESETVTHLVVPLLTALGWTTQRIALEWNKVDLALFDGLPRTPENLEVVVESKRIGQACLSARGQAEDYALSYGSANCRRLIVTDGMRYGVFCRSTTNDVFNNYPDAYLNLQQLIKDYPILRSTGNKDNNGAAKAMALMGADLKSG